MNVKELVEQLSKYNPLASVSLCDSEDILISYISENNATPKTTMQVFIEGCDYCQKCQFYDDGHCRAYAMPCESVEECYQFGEIE